MTRRHTRILTALVLAGTLGAAGCSTDDGGDKGGESASTPMVTGGVLTPDPLSTDVALQTAPPTHAAVTRKATPTTSAPAPKPAPAAAGAPSFAGGTLTVPKSGIAMTLPAGWGLATGKIIAQGPSRDGARPTLTVTNVGVNALPTEAQLRGELTRAGISIQAPTKASTPLGDGLYVPYSLKAGAKNIDVHGTMVIIKGPKGVVVIAFSDPDAATAKSTAESAAKSLKKA